MSSQLTHPSTAPTRATTRARRARTIALETQAAYKVGLAVILGAATLSLSMPIAVAAALMLIAAVLTGISLSALTIDPRAGTRVRVRDLAHTDGALAAALALISVITAVAHDDNAAVIAGAAAIVLAALRLRTRY